MSGYKKFAVVGAGNIGGFITRQLLEEKSAGNINEVVVLTRQDSKATIEGGAKVIPVDYNDHQSMKNALVGVDVAICTIAIPALKVQEGIVRAAKDAGVKLFVPSEFGGTTEGETEGFFGEKASIQDQLRDLNLPYAVFYTGSFSDYIWTSYLDLDVTSGHVSVGGKGDKQLPYTSRLDIARYISYVLTHLPSEQLKIALSE
ncbi:NmrA-like domain-containing protein [Lactifluus volemus]|nr:NmrA-like domain-containing protein [Lactifluus volemus]